MSANTLPSQSIRALPWWRGKRAWRIFSIVFVYLTVTALAVINAFPFYWMITGAFKNEVDVWASPPILIPADWQWQNFPKVFDILPMGTYFFNTMVIVLFQMLGSLLSNTIVAFGFARLHSRWRDLLFIVLLMTMMLPAQVTWLSVFYVFAQLKWMNTFLPLIVPAFFGSAFYIFLLRQFFLTIPLELDEAARIDGANSFRIYWDIFLPLAKPALAAMAIMLFIASWKDYFGPLLYLTKPEMYPLSLGILFLTNNPDYFGQWNLFMAAATILTMPPLLVFLFFQRYFIEGLALSGIKG